jgi:hypothetical protein
MCKPTDLKHNDSPKARGLTLEAEDEILECEIATSPDLQEDNTTDDEDSEQQATDQDEGEEANHHHLTPEQRLDLQERGAHSRLDSARARQLIIDQVASLQATVEQQSTRVTQLEETNNALMEQVRVLTENKTRLLQMVEVVNLLQRYHQADGRN